MPDVLDLPQPRRSNAAQLRELADRARREGDTARAKRLSELAARYDAVENETRPLDVRPMVWGEKPELAEPNLAPGGNLGRTQTRPIRIGGTPSGPLVEVGRGRPEPTLTDAVSAWNQDVSSARAPAVRPDATAIPTGSPALDLPKPAASIGGVDRFSSSRADPAKALLVAESLERKAAAKLGAGEYMEGQKLLALARRQRQDAAVQQASVGPTGVPAVAAAGGIAANLASFGLVPNVSRMARQAREERVASGEAVRPEELAPYLGEDERTPVPLGKEGYETQETVGDLVGMVAGAAPGVAAERAALGAIGRRLGSATYRPRGAVSELGNEINRGVRAERFARKAAGAETPLGRIARSPFEAQIPFAVPEVVNAIREGRDPVEAAEKAIVQGAIAGPAFTAGFEGLGAALHATLKAGRKAAGVGALKAAEALRERRRVRELVDRRLNAEETRAQRREGVPGPIDELAGAEREVGIDVDAARRLREDQGFTIDPRTGKTHEGEGYAVALGGAKPVPLAEAGPGHVRAERERFRDVFRNPKAKLGGWVSDGQAFVEPSEVHGNLFDAAVAGVKRNQLAIYDLTNFKDINLDDEGLRAAGLDPVEVRRAAGETRNVGGGRESVHPLVGLELPTTRGRYMLSEGKLGAEKPETITAAAIRVGGKDDQIFTGPIHYFAEDAAVEHFGLSRPGELKQHGKVEDGFVTSSGRFLSREEALELARQNEPAVYERARAAEESATRERSVRVPLDAFDIPAKTRDQAPIGRLNREGRVGAKTIRFEHYSPTEGLTTLDPKFMGRGRPGAERNRPGRPKASHVYVAGTKPEPQFRGDHKYEGEVPADRVYDLADDRLGLIRKAGGDLDKLERSIAKAGFAGYRNSGGYGSIIKLFEPVPVRRAGALRNRRGALGAENKPEKRRKTAVEAIEDRKTSRTIQEVGEMLARDAGASMGKDATFAQRVHAIVRHAVPVVLGELKAARGVDESGQSWYKSNLRRMESNLREMIPELHDDDEMQLFRFLLAVTSNGNKVQQNLETAVALYQKYLRAGKDLNALGFLRDGVTPEMVAAERVRLKEKFGTAKKGTNKAKRIQYLKDQDPEGSVLKALGDRSVPGSVRWDIMQAQLDKLKELLGPDRSTWGPKLRELYTTRWEKTTRRVGLPKGDSYVSSGPESVNFLGPKIGRFYANLSGMGDDVTIDVWAVRTLRAWMGEVRVGKNKVGDLVTPGPSELEGDLGRAAFADAAKRLREKGVDMDPMDVQAILWYYEKRRHASLGFKSTGEDIGFAEAAENLARKRAEPEQGDLLGRTAGGEGAPPPDAGGREAGEAGGPEHVQAARRALGKLSNRLGALGDDAIVAAAVRDKSRGTEKIGRGATHGEAEDDLLSQLGDGDPDVREFDDGFLTRSGRFVTRDQAREIAFKASQVPRRTLGDGSEHYRPGELGNSSVPAMLSLLVGPGAGALVGPLVIDNDDLTWQEKVGIGALVGLAGGMGAAKLIADGIGALGPDALARERFASPNRRGAVGDMRLPGRIGVNAAPAIAQTPPESSLLEKVLTLHKAGLLTNPATSMANVGGNTSMAALESAKEPIAAGADLVLSVVRSAMTGFKKKPGEFRSKFVSFDGLTKAQWDGVVKGYDVRNREGGKVPNGLKAAWRVLRGEEADPAEAAKWDYRKTKYESAVLQAYTDIVFNSLSAQDAVFKGAAVGRALAEYAREAAFKLGLKSGTKEFGEYVERFMLRPPDDAAVKAVADAEFATFQNDNPFAKWVSSYPEHLVGEPAGRAFVAINLPFVKTPANVLGRTIDYTPLGLVRILTRAAWGEKTGKPLTQKFVSEQVGRAGIGATLLWYGWELAAKGKATGARPTSPQEAALFDEQGKVANGVLIDGKWVQLGRITPAGMLVALGAQIHQIAKKSDSAGQTAASSLGAVGKLMTDQSFLRGVSGIVDALQEPDRAAENYVRSTVGGFVPNIIGRTAAGLDEYKRERTGSTETELGLATSAKNLGRSVGEAVQERIPFAREGLPAKVGVFGQPVREERGVARQLLDPLGTREANTDPVLAEMARVGATPSLPSRTVKAPERQKGTRPRERGETRAWKRDVGPEMKSALTELMGHPDYPRLSDEAKKVLFERVMARTAAEGYDRERGQKERSPAREIVGDALDALAAQWEGQQDRAALDSLVSAWGRGDTAAWNRADPKLQKRAAGRAWEPIRDDATHEYVAAWERGDKDGMAAAYQKARASGVSDERLQAAVRRRASIQDMIRAQSKLAAPRP